MFDAANWPVHLPGIGSAQAVVTVKLVASGSKVFIPPRHVIADRFAGDKAEQEIVFVVAKPAGMDVTGDMSANADELLVEVCAVLDW